MMPSYSQPPYQTCQQFGLKSLEKPEKTLEKHIKTDPKQKKTKKTIEKSKKKQKKKTKRSSAGLELNHEKPQKNKEKQKKQTKQCSGGLELGQAGSRPPEHCFVRFFMFFCFSKVFS